MPRREPGAPAHAAAPCASLGPGPCGAGAQPKPPHAGAMFRKKKKKRPRSRPHRTSSTACTPPSRPQRRQVSRGLHNGRTSWTRCASPSSVVDPSRITRVQLQPMKVRCGAEGGGWGSDHPSPQRAAGRTTQAPGGNVTTSYQLVNVFFSLLISLFLSLGRRSSGLKGEGYPNPQGGRVARLSK